jgi:predicted dienelactone hydrolase
VFNFKPTRCSRWLLTAFLLTVAGTASAASAYDPLAVSAGFQAETLDLTVHDQARNRDLPIKVYLPSQKVPEPVVLFSHGLGGSRTNNEFLGQHWAARGYVGVFLQHPGSDDSVWKDEAQAQRYGALRQAASAQNLKLRLEDVPAVLDQLDKWNAETGNALWHRLDLKHVGMSGHSFGAVTTQGVSGQSLPLVRTRFTDPRIKAACMFSPSSPQRGDATQAFGGVTIPWMIMTGTKDVSPIRDLGVDNRLEVYPALPPGSKYQVILDGAEHSAFGDRPLPGDHEPRNPNHHRVMLAFTTAFWDAYLRQDPAARVWLDGEGAKSVLEKGDKWERK